MTDDKTASGQTLPQEDWDSIAALVAGPPPAGVDAAAWDTLAKLVDDPPAGISQETWDALKQLVTGRPPTGVAPEIWDLIVRFILAIFASLGFTVPDLTPSEPGPWLPPCQCKGRRGAAQ
jgi:hypothetical protein